MNEGWSLNIREAIADACGTETESVPWNLRFDDYDYEDTDDESCDNATRYY